MSEDKKPFTVTDRRHFNAEGDSVPEETAAPVAGAAAEAVPHDLADGGDEPDVPPVPTDLSGLVVMLASQASLLMGGAPGEDGPDLEGARAFIDLLEMLQEKTRGNRTPDEDRLLQEVLYQLRMAFVSRPRGRA